MPRNPKADPNPITDTQSIWRGMQRIGGLVTGDGYNKLQLVQEDGCKQPRTCMRTGQVYLEPPSPYWSKGRIKKWMGEAYHEIGHHQPEVRDMLPLMEDKGLAYNSLLGRLINIVEDYRQEKFMAARGYPGVNDVQSWTQGFYCQQGVYNLQGAKGPMNPDRELFLQVLCQGYHLRGAWQPDVALPSTRIDKYVDYDKYSHLSPLWDELVTAEDVYNLVIRYLEDSPNHDPEEEESKSKAQAKRESEGEEGSGSKSEDGTGSKSEDSDSGDEGEDSSSGSDGEDEGEATSSEDKQFYRDMMGHDHCDPDKPREGGYKCGEVVYDHTPVNDYKPWPDMKVVLARELPEYRGKGCDAMEPHYRSGRSLAGAARRLFQSRTQSRILQNQTSGRLNRRDLYRIPQGADDVFYKHDQQIDTKSTALFLLEDFSGSMSFDKFEVAGAASALMNDAISPLQIPTYIAGFTEGHGGCRHYVIKQWTEQRSANQIMDDHKRCYQYMANNADGESVLWAYNLLQQRPEDRKILIVLSDGRPACSNAGDCATFTRDVVAMVSKRVECYGIGILSPAVRQFYPEYTVLDDVNDLEQTLLDVIKLKLF